MIIDMHTHTFPEKIVDRALGGLSETSGIQYQNAGTNELLKESMEEAGIDVSVVLPVATKPTQSRMLNEAGYALNKLGSKLISFASVHPDNEDYKDILRDAKQMGLKGVKLHPVFQDTDIDDIRYQRIISYASELSLITVIHAGYDVSYPEKCQVVPGKVLSMIESVKPGKLVLAHMGAWSVWEEMTENLLFLKENQVYLDTAFSIDEVNYKKDAIKKFQKDRLSKELFLKMVDLIGSDLVLFGTDSPWCSQKKSVETLQNSGLTESELGKILGGNAKDLLKI